MQARTKEAPTGSLKFTIQPHPCLYKFQRNVTLDSQKVLSFIFLPSFSGFWLILPNRFIDINQNRPIWRRIEGDVVAVRFYIFYSDNAYFEFQLGHRLFILRFSVDYFVSPGKCWHNTSIRPVLLSSKSITTL